MVIWLWHARLWVHPQLAGASQQDRGFDVLSFVSMLPNWRDSKTKSLASTMSVRLLTTVSLFIIQSRITGRTHFHTVPTWSPKNGRTCNALLIMSIVRGRTRKFQPVISIRLDHLQSILRWEHFDAVVAPEANSCNNPHVKTQNGQANLKHVPWAWFFMLVWVYVGGKVSFNIQRNTAINLTYRLHTL